MCADSFADTLWLLVDVIRVVARRLEFPGSGFWFSVASTTIRGSEGETSSCPGEFQFDSKLDPR